MFTRKYFYPTRYIHNTELNDLKILMCRRNIQVYVVRISVCNAIENLENTAYTVYHAPIKVTLYSCYNSNLESMLMSV